MSSLEEEQAKKRIGDPVPDDLVIIYAGRTFEEHLLEILKEKRARIDTGGGLPRFASGGLCTPVEAGREPSEEEHPDTP